MKKTSFTVIIIALTVLMFSACEKTPERESSSVAVIENEPKDEIDKYVTLEEARKEVEELRGKKYLNLSLPQNIMITKENVICDYSAYRVQADDWSEFIPIVEKIWDDFQFIDFENDYYTELSNHAVKGYDYEAREYYHKNDPDEEYIDAIDKNDDNYIGLNCDYYVSSTTWGYYCGDTNNLFNLDLEGKEFEKVAEYNLLWGDVPDDKEYELEGGKMTISDVIGLVEKRCNDAFQIIDGEFFIHKVSYIAVYLLPQSGLHIFDVITSRFHDDIPLDPCENFYNNTSKDWGKAIAGRGMLYYRIIKKNEISCFNEPHDAFKIGNVNEQNKVISLKYAISSVKDQIAVVGMNEIQQCGLVYLFSCDSALKSSDNGYGSFDFISYNKSRDDSIKMRPYWLLALKGKKLTHNASILVDAIDGTVYYYDYSY